MTFTRSSISRMLVAALACLACLFSHASPTLAQRPQQEFDVVVYGGTSSGIAASIQAARMGRSVVLIEPTSHLGGLTTNGLGYTDSGTKSVIGGISREFYQRIKKYYDNRNAWRHESRETYSRYRADDDAMWTFEPHVATHVFRAMLDEHQVVVVKNERLDRSESGVQKKAQPGGPESGSKIVSIRTESGKHWAGKMFIDATYEGDLIAAASVRYTVGREPNATHKERLNGVQRAENIHHHRFIAKVDPYQQPGRPSSGLLPGVDPGPYPDDGQGDHRVQAYCFRMCMTKTESNRAPFLKPAGYTESQYELLFRNFDAGDMRLPFSPAMLPNNKTDTNNKGAVSTDYIGQNFDYPEASYAERERIVAEHLNYQQGLMWTLAHHPRVPVSIRSEMKAWGLAKDEFTENGHWPRQIYVRESRRMVSDYVMSEQDCRGLRKTPMSVGMGSYNMDSHNCMRYVTPDGFVQNEGDVQVSPGGPYQISYLSIVPAKGDAENVLSPVCVSSSHIAYGSIRMEPVFMILGQSAATAACLALDEEVSVQELDYELLKARLLQDKQVLQHDGPRRAAYVGLDPASLKGIVVDDRQASKQGAWANSTSSQHFVGSSYLHDGNQANGPCQIEFKAILPSAGNYEIRIAYAANKNRASNVPLTITTEEGLVKRSINQRKLAPINGAWLSLGVFRLASGANSLKILNAETNGYVVADAVQWLRKP